MCLLEAICFSVLIPDVLNNEHVLGGYVTATLEYNILFFKKKS